MSGIATPSTDHKLNHNDRSKAVNPPKINVKSPAISGYGSTITKICFYRNSASNRWPGGQPVFDGAEMQTHPEALGGWGNDDGLMVATIYGR